MASATAPTEPISNPIRCPTGTLVGMQPGALIIAPAGCHRWACESCGWKNAKRLARRIARTRAQRFLTLTLRPDSRLTAQEQLDLLNRAWRSLWKRIRRRFGPAAVGYVKVIELTKKGIPHAHLGLDTPYLSQRWLSANWKQLTGSSVVDIRRITSERGLARYLAKYLTKGRERVAGRRAYSSSRGFLPPHEADPPQPGEILPSWSYSAAATEALEESLIAQGYAPFGRWFLAPSPQGRPQPPPAPLRSAPAG